MSSGTPLPKQVADSTLEFLMTEILRYVETSTAPPADSEPTEEQVVFAREMSAAKMERMGHSVGYRICERLAQNRTFNASGKDPVAALAAAQLEAVKFVCKEIWMEIFRKQIDKLQTNHRGVFVLKDLELRWLTRLPANQESARVAAIQLLAFPCGIIRGALSNLGITAVVSCDFLADGQNMSACSFNIKIK
jgi:hypothetical protein